jgi:hypothetical protein
MQAACYGYASSAGLFASPDGLRPYMGLGQIISLQNAANSTYNAFQTTMRRTAGPLTLGVSYTYSHSLDNSSDRSDATFVNSYDLASNKASSNFDQRNLLNSAMSWSFRWRRCMPSTPDTSLRHRAKIVMKGWELSGITTFQSGTPFSVVNAGRGQRHFGAGQCRRGEYPGLGILSGCGGQSRMPVFPPAATTDVASDRCF